MRVENCEFPDDLLYDPEGLTWVRTDSPTHATVGITSIYASLAGPLASVAARPSGDPYERGRAIGTLEGGKYFGPIRTPVSGFLEVVNGDVLHRPKLLSEAPYAGGWFARLRMSAWDADRVHLLAGPAAVETLRAQIAALRVRCFAAFPDHEMFEIGTECAAVLVRLNELVERIELGEVVHIVSDDWTAPTEMQNWSAHTGHPIVDARKEGNLHHFLVRKIA